MKLLYSFFFLFQTILFSQFNLDSDYVFYDSVITAKNIFPEIEQDIFIYKLNKNRRSVTLNPNQIISKFKQYGISVNKNGVRRVKFIRVSRDICLDCLGDYIAEEFQNFYPILDVEQVLVFPKKAIKDMPEDYSIIFKNSNLRRSNGYFYIQTDNRRKIHFKYKLKAYLTVIKTSERVRRGTILDSGNTYSTNIKFSRFKSNYITENQLGNIIAKTYIPKDREITDRQIEKIKLIKRNQYIKGFIKDGVVYVEVEVRALQSGGVDDIIRVESPDGARLRGKIINAKLVEIQ